MGTSITIEIADDLYEKIAKRAFLRSGEQAAVWEAIEAAVPWRVNQDRPPPWGGSIFDRDGTFVGQFVGVDPTDSALFVVTTVDEMEVLPFAGGYTWGRAT